MTPMCPACSSPLTGTERFCTQCGQELAGRCPACMSPVVDGARFCAQCGSRINRVSEEPGTEDPALAERRLVTVLFADLVGYSTVSEQRDPEDVREFLSAYFRVAREVIESYGGVVDKFIGDAVMGVWGAPVAREDDAERAVRAALDLVGEVAAVGLEYEVPGTTVRVGVATGEAAVYLSRPAGEGMAGDLVNIASRLEGAADSGTVLVNQGTYRAASRAIAFEPAGNLRLKGKSEPVPAWRPIRVTAKVGGAGKPVELEGPFVGRTAELRTLRDAFRATARDGRARLVSVVGVAGVGKSRLVSELEKHLDGLIETTYWHRGSSPSYRDGVTFWALREMVRTRARITDSDGNDEQLAKIEQVVSEFVPAGERAWVRSGIELLLGLRPVGSVPANEAEAAWRRFFEAISEHAPTVLVFEDLHWADGGLIDFIVSLLTWSRRRPILIVTLARPELLDRRPTWGAGLSGFTGLELEPLEESEVIRLLDGVAPELSKQVKGAIVARAEGIPLYVVETVRMVIDTGEDAVLGEGSIPESLHALVAARLDSLGPDDRRLLQQAAILGQTFDLSALAQLSGINPDALDTRLERLVARQHLRVDDDPRSPERGFYQFVQGVVREVAIGTIGKAERRSLHLKAADYFESLDQEGYLPMAVDHLTAARRLGRSEEAKALAGRVFDLLVRAAARAGGLGSHDQELSFLEQAAGLAPDVAARAGLAIAAAEAARSAGQATRSVEEWTSAHEQFGRLGRPADKATAADGLAAMLLAQGEIARAVELLDKEIAEANAVGLDASQRARLYAQAARARAFNYEGDVAVDLTEQALALAGLSGDVETVAHALITRGWALDSLDRRDECIATFRAGLWLAEKHDVRIADLRARNNLAHYLLWEDPAYALELTVEGMERSRKWGDIDNVVFMSSNASRAAVSLGKWDMAAEMLDEMVEADVSWFAASQLHMNRVMVYALRGHFERCEAVLAAHRDALADSESYQDRWYLHYALLVVSTARGDYEAALEHAQAADSFWPGYEYPRIGLAAVRARDWEVVAEVVQTLDERSSVNSRTASWVRASRGAAAVASGDLDGATQITEAAVALEEAGLVPDAADWLGELAILLPPEHPDRAFAVGRAREIWTELGATPFVTQLDSRL